MTLREFIEKEQKQKRYQNCLVRILDRDDHERLTFALREGIDFDSLDNVLDIEELLDSCVSDYFFFADEYETPTLLVLKLNNARQSLEYRNKLISMYKKGLEDIEAYLNEHASEHDGYRIRLDVADIIRDVEKAVDKAGEL